MFIKTMKRVSVTVSPKLHKNKKYIKKTFDLNYNYRLLNINNENFIKNNKIINSNFVH